MNMLIIADVIMFSRLTTAAIIMLYSPIEGLNRFGGTMKLHARTFKYVVLVKR